MPTSTSDDEPNAEAIRSTALVRASEAYVKRPVFRALMDMAAQLGGFTLEASGFTGASVAIPVAVKAADTTLAKAVSMARERQVARRAMVLNLELSEAGAGLPVDVLTDDRFLHAYDATLRAALRTYRDEKIRLFARLLASASTGDAVTDMDEFEELLSILDDLSYRELRMLSTLEEFERVGLAEAARGEDPRNYAVVAEAFWAQFQLTVHIRTGVPANEVSASMSRLNRTGLFTSFFAYSDYGSDSEAVGYLTPRYYRLRDLIADADGNVITPEPAADPIAPTTTSGAH